MNKKRNLSAPLSESKFDPADYNKDGNVTPREQKKYNKVQRLKNKGKESLEDRSKRRARNLQTAASVAGTVLSTATGVKGLLKKNQ